MSFSWIFLLVKAPDDPDPVRQVYKWVFSFFVILCAIELKVERRKNYDGFKTVKEIEKMLVR